MEQYAGRHFILDGISFSNKTTSISEIYTYIEELTSLLDMTLVFPPLVSQFPFMKNELNSLIKKLEQENISSEILTKYKNLLTERNNKTTGISGIGVLLESHISIHTWPENSFLSIDVFSCKVYDHYDCIEYTLKFFDIRDPNILVIDRYIGKKYEIIYNSQRSSELVV